MSENQSRILNSIIGSQVDNVARDQTDRTKQTSEGGVAQTQTTSARDTIGYVADDESDERSDEGTGTRRIDSQSSRQQSAFQAYQRTVNNNNASGQGSANVGGTNNDNSGSVKRELRHVHFQNDRQHPPPVRNVPCSSRTNETPQNVGAANNELTSRLFNLKIALLQPDGRIEEEETLVTEREYYRIIHRANNIPQCTDALRNMNLRSYDRDQENF